jgi:predicted nucleotidyltransferase
MATMMTLEDLATRLSRAHGAELVAVVLYGSAARGERVEQKSDYNVLVIVRSLTPAALRAAASTTREWGEAGNPPPLLMTESEWKSSRDVFAIEIADILERHRVLTGALPDGPRRVDPAHLRHQLEFEAMGKLLRLRQGILFCDSDPVKELALLSASRSAVLVLFRTLLRVHGEPAEAASEDVVRRAAALAAFDPAPFLAVLAHVTGSAPIATGDADAVLTGYHAGLERFVAHVDAVVRG